MNPFVDRIIRAAKLDVNLYEEVEADKSALGQAMVVVVISSVAAGVGMIDEAGRGPHIYRGCYSTYWLVYMGLPYLFYWD